MPDNAGAQPRDEPLREDGRWRLASRLSVAAAVGALQEAGVPASPSDSAGSFVCNAVLYGTSNGPRRTVTPGPVGFVHLPATETVALEDQERAVERLLRLLAGVDRAAAAGACPREDGEGR